MLLAQGNAPEPEYRATRCSGVNEASSATKAMVVSVIAMRIEDQSGDTTILPFAHWAIEGCSGVDGNVHGLPPTLADCHLVSRGRGEPM
jgi:hypothetical protein